MGSGLLLAILVALWFVVLVPMVVTRGDVSTNPAESMRVLRRRSDRRAMSNSATSSGASSNPAMSNSAMSNGDRHTSKAAADAPGFEAMHTEPIPVLPKSTRTSPPATRPGTAVTASGPPVTAGVVPPAAPAPPPLTPHSVGPPEDQAGRGEIDIRGRRRRMLAGLIALAVLWALFAAFWQPVLWWPQIVCDLVVFGYLVFLRLEAQREQDRQERRRARSVTRPKMPEDRTERMVRAHTQYQAQVTAATQNNNKAIALDDDDPNLAQMPMWEPTETASAAVDDPAYWSARKAV